MRSELIVVFGIVLIVGIAVLAPKLRIAAPLILVVLGVGISLLPGMPPIEIPSELILAGVLPPLLYASAINVPLIDFKENLTRIGVLSVFLVIVSALASGFMLYMIFPDLELAAAIALGAVISPTDAVAASAIGKRLGLPHRLIAVLEGESLVNDASALVLLKSAIAATATAVAFWEVVLSFAYTAVAAILIGLAVGIITVFLRSRLSDSILATAVSFVVPFVAYIPAEVLGASGVLSVVVAGLYTGHMGARYFSASSRISERLNWRTIQFLLENAVFLVMGLQLAGFAASVQDDELSVPEAVLIGLGAAGLLLVVRIIFVLPMVLLERIPPAPRKAREGSPGGPSWLGRMARPRVAPPLSRERGGIGLGGGVVLAWSGMRGVVTVAAAQGLPEETPYRPQLILIAFTVSVATLLVQGGTLPMVIRLAGVRGSKRTEEQAEFADLIAELELAGREVLDNPQLVLPSGESVDPAVVDRVRVDVSLRSASAREQVEENLAGIAPHRQYRELRVEVLRVEREALLEARQQGSFSSHVLVRAQDMLDLEEARLGQGEGGF